MAFLSIQVVSCVEDDTFTSRGGMLSFSVDTLSLDTVFSNVPSTTQSFWVYNPSEYNILCSSIALQNGNQTGFRVNVDGTYLGATVGYQMQNEEIRKGDSIRIFVELTSPMQHSDAPLKLEDNLVFKFEDGSQQQIPLKAYSWDAQLLRNLVITKDTTLQTSKPLVVYGGIKVDSAATLTLGAGTTLYFHEDAGMDVYGSLKSLGGVGQEVVLRGDRLDNMFDYLPYDRTPGQWQGITFHESSKDNELQCTDLHGAYDGIVVSGKDAGKQMLRMESCTVHDCQGYGIVAEHAMVQLNNCQLTNTLHDCVSLMDVSAELNHCTLAQFYPFDANRGAALSFTSPITNLNVKNSLLTGYANDVLTGVLADDSHAYNYSFDHCIIRTPRVETGDSIFFTDVVFEDVKDTLYYGHKHFILMDTDNLRYDFHLSSASPAIGKANVSSSLSLDRDGKERDDTPDVGCYEWKE